MADLQDDDLQETPGVMSGQCQDELNSAFLTKKQFVKNDDGQSAVEGEISSNSNQIAKTIRCDNSNGHTTGTSHPKTANSAKIDEFCNFFVNEASALERMKLLTYLTSVALPVELAFTNNSINFILNKEWNFISEIVTILGNHASLNHLFMLPIRESIHKLTLLICLIMPDRTESISMLLNFLFEKLPSKIIDELNNPSNDYYFIERINILIFVLLHQYSFGFFNIMKLRDIFEPIKRFAKCKLTILEVQKENSNDVNAEPFIASSIETFNPLTNFNFDLDSKSNNKINEELQNDIEEVIGFKNIKSQLIDGCPIFYITVLTSKYSFMTSFSYKKILKFRSIISGIIEKSVIDPLPALPSMISLNLNNSMNEKQLNILMGHVSNFLIACIVCSKNFGIAKRLIINFFSQNKVENMPEVMLNYECFNDQTKPLTSSQNTFPNIKSDNILSKNTDINSDDSINHDKIFMKQYDILNNSQIPDINSHLDSNAKYLDQQNQILNEDSTSNCIRFVPQQLTPKSSSNSPRSQSLLSSPSSSFSSLINPMNHMPLSNLLIGSENFELKSWLYDNQLSHIFISLKDFVHSFQDFRKITKKDLLEKCKINLRSVEEFLIRRKLFLDLADSIEENRIPSIPLQSTRPSQNIVYLNNKMKVLEDMNEKNHLLNIVDSEYNEKRSNQLQYNNHSDINENIEANQFLLENNGLMNKSKARNMQNKSDMYSKFFNMSLQSAYPSKKDNINNLNVNDGEIKKNSRLLLNINNNNNNEENEHDYDDQETKKQEINIDSNHNAMMLCDNINFDKIINSAQHDNNHGKSSHHKIFDSHTLEEMPDCVKELYLNCVDHENNLNDVNNNNNGNKLNSSLFALKTSHQDKNFKIYHNKIPNQVNFFQHRKLNQINHKKNLESSQSNLSKEYSCDINDNLKNISNDHKNFYNINRNSSINTMNKANINTNNSKNLMNCNKQTFDCVSAMFDGDGEFQENQFEEKVSSFSGSGEEDTEILKSRFLKSNKKPKKLNEKHGNVSKINQPLKGTLIKTKFPNDNAI